MFSSRSSGGSRDLQADGPSATEALWLERFRDVTQAIVQPLTNEGSKTTLLLKLELSEFGKVSTHTAESEVRTTLTIPVEERDAPALLRLLGKRVLLRELRTRSSLEKEVLHAEVTRLQRELEESHQREEALRSNLHTLVEGTRRLP